MQYTCFAMLLVSAVQQCESAICIHILPPSWSSLPPTPHISPFYVITEHWVELLVLHSSFPLAIYCTHDNVYMSMLFSQFLPPSPPLPHIHKFVHYICISITALQIDLLLSHQRVCSLPMQTSVRGTQPLCKILSPWGQEGILVWLWTFQVQQMVHSQHPLRVCQMNWMRTTKINPGRRSSQPVLLKLPP